MKKLISVILLLSTTTFFANAQWSGTNPLTTTSTVIINNLLNTWQVNASYLNLTHSDVGATVIAELSSVPILDINYISPSNITTSLLHMQCNGYLGIGITTPQAQLHVLNTIYVTDASLNPLFAVNGNGRVDVYNDIVVKDLNGIECRIYANGLIRAREVKVDLATIPPDYVFDKNYALISLKELEKFLALHKHLPGIPSASEMKEEGSLNVGEMQFKLLEKVEELTLYILKLEKENEEMKNRLCNLENK